MEGGREEEEGEEKKGGLGGNTVVPASCTRFTAVRPRETDRGKGVRYGNCHPLRVLAGSFSGLGREVKSHLLLYSSSGKPRWPAREGRGVS